MSLRQNSADIDARPAPLRTRFVALDQVRGLAIFCMILSHFGPALYNRAGIYGLSRDILDFVGRLATPAFVLIFGITLAIVYIPKTQKDAAAGRRLLLNRALLVLGCSLLVALPTTVRFLLAADGLSASDSPFFDLALRQYSVLSFYAIGIAATGLVIGRIARNPVRYGVIGGAILIFTGSYLGYDAWSPSPGQPAEIARLLLVSGKYGTLVLLGCAWMIIAVGEIVRQRLRAGESYHQDVMVIAIGLCLVALSDGRVVGWRSLYNLHAHYDAPPQFWYLAMVAGIMLATLVFLDRFRIPAFSFILEHIGRSPLSVYVAHAYVRPVAETLQSVWLAVPGTLIDAGCLSAFLGFCAYKIWLSARTQQNARNRAASAGA